MAATACANHRRCYGARFSPSVVSLIVERWRLPEMGLACQCHNPLTMSLGSRRRRGTGEKPVSGTHDDDRLSLVGASGGATVSIRRVAVIACLGTIDRAVPAKRRGESVASKSDAIDERTIATGHGGCD
jgi:hypothetical protein